MPAFKPMVKNEEKPEAAKKNVFTATNEEIKKKQAAAKQKAEEPKPKKSESEVSFFDQIDD
jgi:hypothetical protein